MSCSPPNQTAGAPAVSTYIRDITDKCRNDKMISEENLEKLFSAWRAAGNNLQALPDWLKHEPAPDGKPVEDWQREIDFSLTLPIKLQQQRDRLQFEVRSLVLQLNQRANDPGIYQELVRLGNECRHQLPRFRQWLVDANLVQSRISEIICIVRSEAAAAQFGAGEISVRRALFIARQPAPKNSGGGGKRRKKQTNHKPLLAAWKTLQREAAKAAIAGAPCWTITVGLFRMTFTPLAPKADVTVS